jgi:Ca-activated chloride channel family protein
MRNWLEILTAIACAGVLAGGPLTAAGRGQGQERVIAPETQSDRGGRAQSADAQSASPTFKLESELVVLHVSIFDRSGDAVRGLGQDAFHVIEEGVPQTITFFGGEDVPVAVGLVVDNSGSMLTRRAMVVAGVKAFADSSRADDEAFTVIFNEQVRRGLPDGVPFTHNATLLQSTLGRFPAGGRTALYDAVTSGLDHLATAERQKHVLVVLSDGVDNASLGTEAEMLRKAAREDALIYTVSTARLDAGFGDERLLRRLARLTGGEAFTPRSEAEVVAAFTEIAEKIRRGYSLGYVPTNTAHDGSRRRVTVQVRSPGLRSPRVYTREGYLAPLHDHAR